MSVDTAHLREAIQAVYSEVAGDPKKGYHFHTGPTYAVVHLGYAAADLADLPDSSLGPLPAWALRSHSAHPARGRSSWISVPAAASIPSWLPRPWPESFTSEPLAPTIRREMAFRLPELQHRSRDESPRVGGESPRVE